MSALRDALKAKEFVLETSLAAVPKEGTVTLSDEDFQLNMDAIDRFLELDDVDSVGEYRMYVRMRCTDELFVFVLLSRTAAVHRFLHLISHRILM